jgi:F-type H+-transporting ATPase subunit a
MFILQSQNLFITSPLEQFDLLNLGDWSFFGYALILNNTNGQFFLVFAMLLLSLFFIQYNHNASWLPQPTNNLNAMLETLFQELMVLIYRNVGLSVGQLYFPWLVFTFFVVAMLNLVGMIPYAFTITSHIVVTFTLSFTLFIGINIRSILDKKLEFMALFLPSGAPIAIAPFLVIIELISYIARVFSLAIRLFANMMAGHTLLKILIGFAFTIGAQSLSNNWFLLVAAVIPFILVFVITFLEVAIALLQGYVFTVLMALYIKDLYTSH